MNSYIVFVAIAAASFLGPVAFRENQKWNERASRDGEGRDVSYSQIGQRPVPFDGDVPRFTSGFT